MPTKKLNINMIDVVDAMEHVFDESAAYLDTQTGQVLVVQGEFLSDMEGEEDDESWGDDPEWMHEEREIAKKIMNDTENRYQEIPGIESREAYRFMESFIDTLPDPNLREKLQIAISGKGAFRRFKDVLASNSEPLLKQWFTFEQERKSECARDWLESINIEPI